MRFIGSKERLLPFIEEAWQRFVGPGIFRVGDVFCGTAVVSNLFKRLGNKVVANDNLQLGYVLAQAALNVNEEPAFCRLAKGGEILEDTNSSFCATDYERVLTYLNRISGEEGFIFREYCPGGTHDSEYERWYFSDDNAKKIDGIRRKLAIWKNADLLNDAEYCLLLADLLRATNRVANTAGTYGCFMKHWDTRAQRPLRLQRSSITQSNFSHDVFCKDANSLVQELEFDVLYLDPPYTWRHYGAYYHILETIVREDDPVVSGRTGLRPWQDSKSRYCDRTDAVNALKELIECSRTRHLFLSYNSEGLVSHDQIMQMLNTRGKTICLEVNYRRFRSNNGGSKKNSLKERLYYVKTND